MTMIERQDADTVRAPEPILVHCEGSGCPPCDGLWLCAMCGMPYSIEEDGNLPAHDRSDILAMLERGDFDG